MEQQRMSLALALCFLVWFGWMMLNFPKRPFPANNAVAGNEAPGNVAAPGNQPATGGPIPSGVEGEFKHPQVPVEYVTAKNERYEVTFTNHGAAIDTLVLAGILDHRGGQSLRLLQAFDPERLSLNAGVGIPDDPALTANWEKLEPEKGEAARFRYTYPNGLELTKTFGFEGEKFGLRVKVIARNRSKGALPYSLQLTGASGVAHDSQDVGSHLGAYALFNDKERWDHTADVTLDKLRKAERRIEGSAATWSGIYNKYFATMLVPRAADTGDGKRQDGDSPKVAEFVFTPLAELSELNRLTVEAKAASQPPGAALTPEQLADVRTRASINLAVAVRMAPVPIGPDQECRHEFTFYAGPKRLEDLQAFGKEHGFDVVADLGWTTPISNLLLWILGVFHSIFGNYGVSIICLTLMVKCCLFPLTKKGQISAFRMQKVAPEMQRLKEKYEDDKQRMNVEVMKLYREHGVNPITGCLPMFFQIPVFIGLYRGLGASFELRQQPFFGWISDLSRPDVLAVFPFSIPFTGVNELHLLPILMTITWLIQSLLQPKSPDPNMALNQKMMTFMPVVFGFMLYSMPAGLILYWFTSTLLAIGEQQYIKKKYLKA